MIFMIHGHQTSGWVVRGVSASTLNLLIIFGYIFKFPVNNDSWIINTNNFEDIIITIKKLLKIKSIKSVHEISDLENDFLDIFVN